MVTSSHPHRLLKTSLAERCVVLDLEATFPRAPGQAQHITALGAFRPANHTTFHWTGHPRELPTALLRLADFCRNADLLVGHNWRRHDAALLAPHEAAREVLQLPVLDTLELSPLAFPRNPYHHLVKDYKLVSASKSDPLADAQLTWQLLSDQNETFRLLHPELLSLYRRLLGPLPGTAYDRFFAELGAKALDEHQLWEYLLRQLRTPEPALTPAEQPPHPSTSTGVTGGAHTKSVPRPPHQVCDTQLVECVAPFWAAPARAPVLAYVLAWLSTVGGSKLSDANSVVPSWVRLQYPELSQLVHRLRDTPCNSPTCSYCIHAHNLENALARYFGFSGFRTNPGQSGQSLQRDITTSLARGEDLMAILPTGGGKSICFQLPALLWAARTKRLTLILSPLQSLMKDQVDVLRQRHGIPNAAALYGGLNPLERTQVLEGVVNGDYDLLYIAPEQLRNHSFREVIKQRELAAWIIDEAHCLSKWGHDFRPDYLYIGRFIRELTQELKRPPPTIACFTATAKPEVIDEICHFFQRDLGRSLKRFEGSPQRDNLDFLVIQAPANAKLHHVIDLLQQHIQADGKGGTAVIYASSRRATEKLAQALQAEGWRAEYYHAGRSKEKQDIQDQFIRGELPVIVATNAFGMGVDKDDVRLVVHADIPGSLEAYLQEAGRAGRDRKPAQCVLLYDPSDVDAQFRLQGSNRVALRDIQELLKGIRNRARRLKQEEVVVTSGELLQEEIETDIDLEDRQFDRKVKTAVLVLEQGELIERNENRFAVFQGKLRFNRLSELENQLQGLKLSAEHLERCRRVCQVLLNSQEDQTHSTDLLADQCGMSPHELMRVLKTLREAQLANLSLQLTAQVTYGVQGDSLSRLEALAKLERTLIHALQEDPQLPAEAGEGWELELNLRALCHVLNERRLTVTPAEVRPLLFSLRKAGAWKLARRGGERYAVELKLTMPQIETLSRDSLAVAQVVLQRLLEPLRKAGRTTGADNKTRGMQLTSFTLADLEQALSADMFTRQLGELEEHAKTALLFLHDQRVIVLQGGLTVLRPAMTLRLKAGGRVTKAHYKPLEELYRSQVIHIHVMDRYARLGATQMNEALELVADYFRLEEDAFLERHFPGERQSVSRPTSTRMYQRIVEELGDKTQQAIVTSKARAMLVLAGPGSGKTRIVVHRMAYLLEVERVPPEHLLVLTFNRAAAREIRRRLIALLGDTGRLVSVYTYHSLAMSLIGLDLTSPEAHKRMAADDEQGQRASWDQLILDACAVLEGKTNALSGIIELEEWRTRVVSWRYIFVDEYQDVNAAQYQLIRALTGLHLSDEEERLTLMAVGDDDQSIYAFNGARVEYLRRFETDYAADRQQLLVNYRSTVPIVQASSALIALNRERMKQGLELKSGRKPSHTAGPTPALIPVTVRAVHDAVEAARATIELLKGLAAQNKTHQPWRELAVLSRHHHQLQGLELLCQREGIPSRRLSRERLPFHRLRPVRQVLDRLQLWPQRILRGRELRELIAEAYGGNPLDDIGLELLELVVDWETEVGGKPATARSFIESIYDRQRDTREGDRSRLLLATLHAAKGLEFNNVILLGAPTHKASDATLDTLEEERRLFYVGMTRARQQLWIVDERTRPSPFVGELLQQVSPKLLRQERGPVTLQPGDRDIRGLQVAELALDELWTSYPAEGARGLLGAVVRQLRPGDQLKLQVPDSSSPASSSKITRLALLSGRTIVGMLSQKGSQRFLWGDGRWKVDVLEVTVAAVIVMDRAERGTERGTEAVERWELVVPRVVFRTHQSY